MLQLAKGVCSQESTASGDHVVLFVNDETFSYNFHLSCMLSSWNSIFPWKVLKFLCKTLKAHPQEHKYFTHYSWLPDLNGATVLGKLGLLQVITRCCYTPHKRKSQLSRLTLGVCQYRTWTLQYPRLSFRVNTATEIFQHIIQTMKARVSSFPKGESAKVEVADDMESVFTE